MNASDVRVGDLVKFTNKQHSEVTFTSRVRKLPAGPYYQSRSLGGASLYIEDWDIEVLDRPLPPIDEELLRGAKSAYDKAKGFEVAPNRTALTAVINFVREYDQKNATKENA